MTRHAPALLALSIIAVAGWTYNVNYDTRAALDRLSGLRAEIAGQREALQVLRVEWAYLNAPDRLTELVAAHNGALGLVPLVPEGLSIAAAIPYPPRETPDLPPTPPEALIAAAPPPAESATGRPAAEPAAEPAAAEPETITVAALSGPRPAAATPAVLRASALPAPSPAGAATGSVDETVPAALEAAIAAALVEVGVSTDARPGAPQNGVIAVPADASAGAFASGVPLPRPAARPVAWSRP